MLRKYKIQWVAYLLHSEKHYSLFGHFFGEQLKAE